MAQINNNYSGLKRKTTQEKSFHIVQLNCNSITNKASELKIYVYSLKPDIVCLCETHLKRNEPRFHGYHGEWMHRVGGEKGGLGLLIREDIRYKMKNLNQFPAGHLEYQAIEVNCNMGIINIMNIYNPHQNITTQEFNHYINQLGNRYILIGDLNAHSAIWDMRGRNNGTGRSLESVMASGRLGLLNAPEVATYIDHRTGTSSCLDLCMPSMNLTNVGELCRGKDLGSDHFPIECRFGVEVTKSDMATQRRWKTKDVDWKTWSGMVEEDDVMNSHTTLPTNTEEYNDILTEKIINASEACIQKTSGVRRCKRTTPWWCEACKAAVEARRVARNRLWRHPTPRNLINYRKCEATAKHICLKKKKESWRQFTSTLDGNTPSAKVWNALRSINGKQTSRICPIGDYLTDNKTKAEEFLGQFTQLNTVTLVPGDAEVVRVTNSISERPSVGQFTPISMLELTRAMANLKNTSPGVDNVMNIFLKKLPKCALEMFLDMYNTSLITGYIPPSWKTGIVCPILKPNKDPSLVNSYRPITLLSCIGKLIERIIQKRLEYFLESNFVFPVSQSGFRRGGSTIDVLAAIVHNVRKTFEKKEYCIIVYIDLQSAYDCVWHDGLLCKLKKLNICPILLYWLFNYLKDRNICVRVGAELSESTPLRRGLPQGAALSPLLFNVMLHDLPQSANVKVLSYADDITLLSKAATLEEAKRNMQSYLDDLVDWLAQWKFIVNPQKCSYQIFTKKRNIPNIDLSLNNQRIMEVNQQRVLGIIMDSPKLTMNQHISNLKLECKRRINVMRAISSNKWGASRVMLRRVYISFIRSKMEYGCITFLELSDKLKQKLSVVQNEALRIILGARKTSPILSLEVESYIMPLELRFQFLLSKWCLKVMHSPSYPGGDSLADEVGLVPLNNSNSNYYANKAITTFQLLKIPVIKRVPTGKLSPVPPTKNIDEVICREHTPCDVGLAPPGMVGRVYSEYIDLHYPHSVRVYTDGSKLDCGSTAAAVYLQQPGTVTTWRLNPMHTVLGSELFAIHKALLIASQCADYQGKPILILTDSMSALHAVANTENPNYKSIVFEIQRLICMRSPMIALRWVRAHVGIRGNEIVDAAAKMGHTNLTSVMSTLSLNEILIDMKHKFYEYWIIYWKRMVNQTLKGTFLSNILDKPTYPTWMNLDSRLAECAVTRLRIGHVGVASHMNRFQMMDSDLCATCGVRETPQHYLVECPHHSDARNVLIASLRQLNVDFNMKNVLCCGDFDVKKQRKIVRSLIKYLRDTDRIDKL